MPSKSISQQQAAGIALAAKNGKISVSKLKGAAKEMYKMSKKDLEDFAKTKHQGLPDKVKKEQEEKLREVIRKEILKELRGGNVGNVQVFIDNVGDLHFIKDTRSLTINKQYINDLIKMLKKF